VKVRAEDAKLLVNLLVAYPYMTKGPLAAITESTAKIRFLLDSGAFTAWKAGRVIDVDDYCKFIESMPFKPWRYFTLDVIGDPGGTMRNYETMLKRGFKPVPIFTRGEDVSVIDDYYKTSDVVGIGGLVGTQGNKGFVNGIMEKVGKRRCHWLGFTNMGFLRAYKPYMCDTSSWESGARFAIFKPYLGAGRTCQVQKTDFIKRPSEVIVRALRSYGVDARDLALDKNWRGGYSVNRALAALSGVRMSLDVQRSLGTLSFLAATTVHAIKLLVRGYDFEMQRGTA
jgi:hypothetical protein